MRDCTLYKVLEVNEDEVHHRTCQRILVLRGGQWNLSVYGQRLIDLLTY
ncbi:MAG: hypothetical protein RMN51_08200 [Verrucomicrobiota bacterium]|nr:hypothetical protein [Limisphaera sp.]MDW8382070.1 hypothetical protein [Verrucomicrobiota bacterium]